MKKNCATRPGKGSNAHGFDVLALEPGESVGLIGVSRFGKSKYAKELAARLLEDGRCVLAWDPAWEWGQDALQRESTPPGPLARTITVSELEDKPQLLKADELNLAVGPDDPFALSTDVAEDFKRFCFLARRNAPARAHLFIDEVNEVRDAVVQLDDIAERWGKDGWQCTFIGQRWTHLSPNVRAQCRWLISFCQNKDSDLSLLTRDAGAELADAVCAFGKHEFRVVDLHRVQAEKRAARRSSNPTPQKEEEANA